MSESSSSVESVNNVEHFLYRIYTRGISILHLSLIFLFNLKVNALLVFLIYLSVQRNEGLPEGVVESTIDAVATIMPPQLTVDSSNVVAYLWIILVVGVVFDANQFAAGCKLFKSSKYSANPAVAASQARFWRNTNIFFLFLYFIYGVITLRWIFLLVTMPTTSVFIIVVCLYIAELEAVANKGKSGSEEREEETEESESVP